MPTVYAQRGYDRNFIVKDEAKLKKFLENFEEEYCFAEQEVRSVFEPPFSDIELKSLGFNNLCLHLKNMNISSSEENDMLIKETTFRWQRYFQYRHRKE